MPEEEEEEEGQTPQKNGFFEEALETTQELIHSPNTRQEIEEETKVEDA